MAQTNTKLILILWRATSKVKRGALGPRDYPYACRGRQADQSQEQADAGGAGNLERRWDKRYKPVTHSDERQEDEYESFHEDGGQRKAVGNGAGPMKAHNLVGEVGIKPHPRPKEYSARIFGPR